MLLVIYEKRTLLLSFSGHEMKACGAWRNMRDVAEGNRDTVWLDGNWSMENMRK